MNWDNARKDVSVFVIQDAIKFPVVHEVKPKFHNEILQGEVHSNFWDFFGLQLEREFFDLWLLSLYIYRRLELPIWLCGSYQIKGSLIVPHNAGFLCQHLHVARCEGRTTFRPVSSHTGS